jgi:TetR/AcrR family transcriptional regulator, transcriptional repressor for nem operon
MPRPREFDERTVVEHAMHAFWDGGFAATGMRDVAAATGLLPGSLHQAFGSKRHLFLLALDRYAAMGLAHLAATLHRPGAVLDNLRDALLQAAQPKARARGCLMAQAAAELAPRDKAVTAKVRAMSRRREDLFASALLRAQQAGEIGPRDVRVLARFLVTSLEGLRVYGKTQPAGRNLADVVDTIVQACR